MSSKTITTTTTTTTNSNTKVFPMKKNNKKKSKVQDELDRLRKSKHFRALGDALDYFSD